MDDKNMYAKWTCITLIFTIIVLAIVASVTIMVDPFFHYHKPCAALQYRFGEERYINDGIARHFDYDAVITGTSMTQNFKTTEFDALWGANSIKIPYAGASYKEVDESIGQALSYNPDIKYILRGLDRKSVISDKDAMRYEENYYPRYLYDDIPFNDVKYILNKSVFFEEVMNVFRYTRAGGKTTTFDEYNNWNASRTFGKEAVLKTYTRSEMKNEKTALTQSDIEMVRENIAQNVTSLPQRHPDVKFYYFFTPYSICYWDSLNQTGELFREIEAEKIAIEMILEVENIELYSFEDRFDVICNLDHYKDIAHYSEDINSQILKWIHNGMHRITKDNYKQYLDEIKSFYSTYPYDEIFAVKE